MATSTPGLVTVLIVSVAVLVLLINSRLRLHPFVALLLVSVGVGLAAGEPAAKIPTSLEAGAGAILGNVGITLALGAMMGRLLADSRATEVIAAAVVRRSTPRTLPWLMAAAAFVIGIPMFFEVGLIVLLPLVFSVAERMRKLGHTQYSPYTALVVPTVAVLATLHGTVPPHPGPLTAVAGLHADLGKTILLGLICAVPTVILAGPVFGTWMASRIEVLPDRALVDQFVRERAGDASPAPAPSAEVLSGQGPGAAARPVPIGWAVTCILIPVVLMLFRTLAEIALPAGDHLRNATLLVGEPVIAMLIGFVVALYALALARGRSGEAVRQSVMESLKAIVGILLIIGAGGAFNKVLDDTGISHAIASAASGAHVNVVILGWLLALLLSASTGSATVGIVSATGIIAPLVSAGTWHTSLVVLAIGAGSIGLNYVNHAGFWLVKESFGMDMGQATKIHTTTQTLVSVLGLGMTLLLSAFV